MLRSTVELGRAFLLLLSVPHVAYGVRCEERKDRVILSAKAKLLPARTCLISVNSVHTRPLGFSLVSCAALSRLMAEVMLLVGVSSVGKTKSSLLLEDKDWNGWNFA